MVDTVDAFTDFEGIYPAQCLEPPMIQNQITFFGPTFFEVAEDTVSNNPYTVLFNIIFGAFQIMLSVKYSHFMQGALGILLTMVLTIINILGGIYLRGSERTKKLITSRDREPRK